MILRESVGIALGALRANKLRSFLTLLGTIIGVMSVIAVVSFVEGMNRYVSDKLIDAGSNTFEVDKFGLIMSQEAYDEARKRPDVTVAEGDMLRERLRTASQVVIAQATSLNVRYRSKLVANVRVRGRSAGYEIIDDLAIDAGRHLNDFDDQRRQLTCVIGPEVAEELFENLDPVGRRIRVGDHLYEIVGVGKAKGRVLGESQDRYVIVPIRTFVKYEMERGSVSVLVKSRDQASLPATQQEVRNLLRARRHLGPGKPDNFAITTSDAYMDLYRNLTGGIFVVSIGVAAISLLVGGIVIMNIMLVSVTERTREIGVRKALGARRRDILTQFLVESITLSLAGGMTGIVLGVAIALLVGAISPLPAAVNVPALFLGILMSTGVGVFFGSYPAVRAARLDPIEALRYE